jgi:hypothetical protein
MDQNSQDINNEDNEDLSIESAKKNILNIQKVASSIIEAIKETRDNILAGKDNLSETKNSKLLEFAIGKNKSIVPALNQLSQLLTRTINKESKKNKNIDDNIEMAQLEDGDEDILLRNFNKLNGINPNYSNFT